MVLNSFPFYRRVLTGFLASAFLLGGVSGARAQTIIQDYYVPMPEAQIRNSFATLAPSSSAQIESVISMVVAVAGTRIVYDHWEDGYETNLNSPVQSTTRVWGDGNNANGIPPGFVNDPASFSFGAVIAARNLVPLPRNPANILYDGRDRVGATRGIVMSRSGWGSPDPGPLLADATEVSSTVDWGTNYRIPIGQNVIFPTPLTSSMFEHVSLMVMAALNNTQIQIDTDGNGSTDITTTINQGESYQVTSGIQSGARVTSTKPVQVQVLTGDIGANYESRWFTIPPMDQWSPEYYSPVGTASDGDDTYIFLYNPNPGAITIAYTTQTGSGSFPIPAGTTYRFLAPQNSGTRFLSVGEEDFFGVGTVGAEPTQNNVHDWGFDLVPHENLTTEAVVGWGPGSSDLTQNGSPVWVTPAAATTIYVDYNGDRLGAFTDPAGGKYDFAISSPALQVNRVYESDRDQTGMRLYTLDGTLLTAAWGQDPAVAGPAMPYLDVGTTIPNFPVPTMVKTSELINDVAPVGLSLGDTIRYTITLDNRGLVAIGNTIVTDALPVALAYVNNSTDRDGVPIPDAGVTNFPLDESGYTIPILPRRASTSLSFNAVIIASGSIVNTATSSVGAVSTNVVVVPPGTTDVCTLDFTNSSGTTVTAPNPGDNVYVTIQDDDANTNAASIQNIAVTVVNGSNGDFETITLTETAVNSGLFRNTSPLPTSTSGGLTPNDGTLRMVLGDTLTAAYTDPVYSDTCNDSVSVAAATATKILYLDTDGSDGDAAGDMDRVDPAASPVDNTTSNTSTIAGPVASTVTAGTTTTSSNSNTSSLTFSYTPSAGSNRILLVSIAVGGTGLNSTPGNIQAVNGVTYGGTALTPVGNIVSDQTRSAIYALASPAAGPLDVVVSLTAASSVYAAATTFTGVNVSSGLTSALGTGVTTSAASGTASVTVSSATGELVFATTSYDEGLSNQSITTPVDQAELFNGSGFNFTSAAGSTKPGAAPNVTLTNGRGDSQEWASVGVAIKPAPGTTGSSVTFTQTPTFCENFTLPLGATVSAQAYFSVISGSMIASPNVSAVLRRVSGATVATSSSASSDGTKLTFAFPALGAAATVVSGDALQLVITNNQTGVTFQVQYDSTTKPSFVSFGTTSVIHVDSVGVYDAPYSGGTLTASSSNGSTLYVRTVVGDPFGFADVTSLPLVIDGPGAIDDISTTLTDSNMVANTTCTKTYEYTWPTGVTTGTYSITATGKEGSENTVSDSKSTSVVLSALDLGTPCTNYEFTSGLNGASTSTYAADVSVCVRVTDVDQNTNVGVAETVSATVTAGSGDFETFTLNETAVNSGVFAGCTPASSSVVGSTNNGSLYAPLGTTLTASYTDPTDGTDVCSDTGSVPAGSPAITVTKTLLAPVDGIAVVGESIQYRVRVANTGNTTLNTIALSDTFPAANLTYVSSSPTHTSTGVGTISWTDITGVGSLAPGGVQDVIVNFTALASAAPAVNSATADAGGGVTGTDAENVTITNPALAIVKTLVSPNPGPAAIGDSVVFSIVVTNTGNTTINTLPLEDTFGTVCFDYTFVSASITPDGVGAGSVVWNDITGAGSLAPAASIPITLTMQVAGSCNPATNTATAAFVTDINGDSVPPVSDDATIVTLAASISGFVYEDQGAAGFGGDVPIQDVVVELYTDPNGDGDPSDGVLVDWLQTLSNGSYEFGNLPLGNYVVVETDPFGYSSIDDTEGAAADNRISVVAAAYTAYPNNNFLDDIIDPATYGSISGQVREDVDWDGDLGDADAGIDGVTIDLYTDPNGDGDPSDGVLFLSTVTAGGGNYSFTSIPPGDYVVVENDPLGYYSTEDFDGGNDNQIAVTLPPSGNVPGNDFLDSQDCTVDADCTDALFCNGTETCVANECTAGTDPCTGGADCADTCYEAADNCFDPAATACGSASDTVCDNPDTCNGSGVCQPNFESALTVCRADSGQCDVAETCDGAGSCPADAFEPNTTACTGSSQGGVCDNDPADRCTGTSTACVDAYRSAATVCRADSGQCDVAELCTGSSGACPADVFEPNTTACTGSSQAGVCDNDAADRCTGTSTACVDAYQSAVTVCRADSGQCDVAELCTGASGACPADVFEPNTTSCTGASQAGVCDNDAADRCTGTSTACVDAYQPNTTTCRADAGQCDVAETCTGASGSCPADVFEPNTTSCTGASQAGVCDNDAADVCSGTANTCVDAYQPNTTECRADAGQCDVAENCTGSSGACPADVFEPNTTSCTGTSQAGVCDNDAADVCSGTANTCVDAYQSAVTVCRADAGQCDVAELCTGASGACPADVFEPNTTSCTGASQAGVCDNDAADRCTGTANTCVDAYQSAVTVCRADAGQCDVAELCTGSSGACPADVFEPNTTACTGTSQAGVCDNDAADRCTGTSTACVDAYQSAVTVCRADAGQCDVAELCTGSSGACPADAFEPNTTACTGASQAGVCDNDAADRCTGTANTCVDAYQSAATVCRADSGQCDVAELCTGSSGACPADAFEPNTTACTGASQAGVCDNDAADRCTGTANTCVDAYQSAVTVCRVDAGQCDVAELCTGSSGACPANVFEPNTTACTGSSQAGVCDNDAADRCTGTANTCVDAYRSAVTVCRADAGLCDVAELCTGISGACPANAFEPNGTSCNDLAFCNGLDTCSAGACVSAGDPCSGLGCDELNDVCLLPVNLSVTKTDLSDPVLQGGTLVYSVAVQNAGPAPATNVVVTDTLDANTTYVSNTGGCTHLLGVLTCNYPVIANGGSQSFTVTVTVGAAAPTASTLRTGACNGTEDLCNDVVVTATETDTDPSDNADDEPTDVEVPGPASLVLTKTDLPDPVAPGATLTYTLNYANAGPDPLLNAQLVETYDVRTTFVSASPPPDFGNNTWVIGDLDPGETGTIIITTTVSGALTDGTVLNNHAILSADLTPSVTVDEPTTVRTSSANHAALGILKTVSPSVAPAGALLTYTVTASNSGPATSYDTIVSDSLPAGLTYMNATPTPDLVLGNYIEWNAGDLPAGSSRQFVVYAETASTLDAGTLLENCGEAAGATGPGTVASAGLSAQGCATASITGAGQDCRLVMTKRGVGIAQPGGEIVYRCLWCDPCVDAPSVFVVDDLPPEVEFVSVSSRDMRGYQLLDNSGLQQLVLDIGLLPKGRAGIAYIRTRVKDNVAPGTIVSNDIRIEDAAGRTRSDTDLTTIGTGVASDLRGLPSLRVTGNTRAKTGGSVQYMARYSNLAPGSTAMVTLTDTINPTYVSPAPTTRSTRSLVWKGLSGSGIIKVKGKTVMSDPAARGGVVSVEAMVTGPDGSEVVKAGVDTALLASTSGGGGSGGGGDTPAAGSSGKASLTAPSFVRAGLTSTLMLRYSKLVGASKASMTVPEGVGVESTFPRASSIEGNVIKWDGLAATSGILKVTIVVPENVSPGASLTVGATVTDDAGAVGLERTMGVR